MFRLQNNVPEVYVEESRDFQLFCRLYDLIFGGVKHSIDSLEKSTSTKECDVTLLELLKTKLGLFTTTIVDNEDLRNVLQIFPTVSRHKGTKQAIDYILTFYSRMNTSVGTISYNVSKLTTDYTLELIFSSNVGDISLLLELLACILPTGYNIEYTVGNNDVTTNLTTHDELVYETTENVDRFSQVWSSKISEDLGELGATVGATLVSDGITEETT